MGHRSVVLKQNGWMIHKDRLNVSLHRVSLENLDGSLCGGVFMVLGIANAKVLVAGSTPIGVNFCIFSIKLLALGR